MNRLVSMLVLAGLLLVPVTGLAEEAAAGEAAAKEEKKLYNKKLGGKLWAELTFGGGTLNMTKFQEKFLPTGDFNYKDKAPNVGGAIGIRAGSTLLGVRLSSSKYSAFKMRQVGLDFMFNFRFVPYVHPYIRFALMYAWLKHKNFEAAGVPNTGPEFLATEINGKKYHGVAIWGGFGVRIPLMKYLSLSAGFDFIPIAFLRTGSLSPAAVAGGDDPAGGTFGMLTQGTVSIAFHL